MIQASLRSQIDQVHSILANLQSEIDPLSEEQQREVIQEVERALFDFRNKFQITRSQAGLQEMMHFTLDGDPDGSSGPQEHDAWLQHAIRQAHVGAWKWDLVHWTIQGSSEIYEMLGLDNNTGTIPPSTFIEMIHPDDRQSSLDTFTRDVERGEPFYQEFRVVRPDGTTIWLSSSGSVECDASGRPIHVAGINQDITARKEAEEALRASEARERARAAELEAMMDAVPAMIWISRDPECKEMFGNRYGYEFLDMWQGANISKTAPDQERARQPYRNYKDGREVPTSELPMQIAAATGVGTSDYEFELVFSNGVAKNLLGNIVPTLDSDGKPSGAVGAFVDITERKSIEAELRQNEANLRHWQEQIDFWSHTTNSSFWFLDPDGAYRSPSLIAPFFTGRSFEQNSEFKWLEIFHPDDRELIMTRLGDAKRLQEPFSIEARIWSHAEQAYRWYFHQAVPSFEQGVFKGWIGASTDIQARKEMIEALERIQTGLRKSEANERARAAELQTIMDAVPTPILLARTPDGTEISGNLAACRLLGAQPGENLADFLQARNGSRVRQILFNGTLLKPDEIPLIAALRTGQAVKDFEGTVLFKDGSEKNLYGNVTPLWGADSQLAGAVGVFMDITERVAAERALRESEQRFRVALSSAPIVVFTLDKELRYTWLYNPRHGLVADELVGKRGEDVQPLQNVIEFTEAKQTALETGQPVQREIRVRIGDIWANYIITLVPSTDAQGQVNGLVGAALETTMQRRLEALQQENEIRLAAQRRLLETREAERIMISRDIHDGPIQTIVSTIFNLQIMKSLLTDGAAISELNQIADNLKNAVRELRQVINELRPPTLARFGLSKAVEGLVEEFQERYPQVNFLLDVANGPTQPTDQISLALFRICQEALNNIVRHSGATQAFIRLTVEQGQILLTIQDNGKGIPAPIDIVSLSQGHHYGLAGMRERAEALGGTLTIESQVGAGTTIATAVPNPSA